jgi:hypothetical protein
MKITHQPTELCNGDDENKHQPDAVEELNELMNLKEWMAFMVIQLPILKWTLAVDKGVESGFVDDTLTCNIIGLVLLHYFLQ